MAPQEILHFVKESVKKRRPIVVLTSSFKILPSNRAMTLSCKWPQNVYVQTYKNQVVLEMELT